MKKINLPLEGSGVCGHSPEEWMNFESTEEGYWEFEKDGILFSTSFTRYPCKKCNAETERRLKERVDEYLRKLKEEKSKGLKVRFKDD